MKYILQNVNIIDGTYPVTIKEHKNVLIEDGWIKEISDSPILDDSRTINCYGTYLVPGLINLHAHMPANGKLSKKSTKNTKLIKFLKTTKLGRNIGLSIVKANAKRELFSGTTTVRAVGGVGDLDSATRDLINKGKTVGARLYVANEAICSEGGHMQGTVSVPAHDNEEAINMVIERANQGADLIKVMITGGVLDCKEVGHPGDLKMEASMVKAICDKAHELGLKVAAHVEGPEGMAVAIDGGVDTIEHGADVDDKHLDAFIARGGVLVATFSPAIPLAKLDLTKLGFGEVARINSQALIDSFMKLIYKMKERNGVIALGTDVGCPLITHYDSWREIPYYANSVKGVDLGFALHTMTEVNASVLGIADKVGVVRENMIADLVLLKDNPLEHIETFAHPIFVMKDGIMYKKEVKKNKDIEKQLSKIDLH